MTDKHRRRSSAAVMREHLVWARRHFAERYTPEERLALAVLIAGFERIGGPQ